MITLTKNSAWLLCVVGFFSVSQFASAIALSTNDGAVHEGEIDGLFKGVVTIVDGSGNETEVPVESLNPDSSAALDKWVEENPHMVNVYKKFDSPPSPAKTNNPSKFLEKEFKKESGMVAVDIVISENGEVIWANVAKSSNENLNKASVEAISEWRFKPAKVDGSPIRSRIRVPFQY